MVSDADVLLLGFFFPNSYLFFWNMECVLDSAGMQQVSHDQFDAFLE